MFFFEKKNQKTFITCLDLYYRLHGPWIKVFCFFFSKKKFFLADDPCGHKCVFIG